MSDKLVIDEHIMEKLENIQLIITDIDGTLLKDDQTIESRTKQLLVDAHNMGIHTAIATGRAVDAHYRRQGRVLQGGAQRRIQGLPDPGGEKRRRHGR